MTVKTASNLLATRIEKEIEGKVLYDDASLAKYAGDRSIYRIVPRVVVLPAGMEDLEAVVAIARQEGLAITPRGGGSGTAGSALGEGIILAFEGGGPLGSTSAFSRQGDSCRVTTGAGLRHDRLQHFLRERGYYLPADPTSGAISRIGGNIATRASGPHALRHGSIDRFLESVVFLTNRGEWVDTADESTLPGRIVEGLHRVGRRLRENGKAAQRLIARRGMKTASGYNLFPLLDDLSPGKIVTGLFAGSVGTLGILVSANLRGVPFDPVRRVIILPFPTLPAAGEAVPSLIRDGVAAIELVDEKSFVLAKSRDPGALPSLPDSNLLFVEFEGELGEETFERVKKEAAALPLAGEPVSVGTDEGIEKTWAFRKGLYPALIQFGPSRRALSVVNDVGVPPEDLAGFLTDVERFFAKQGMEFFLYGHAGRGNLHLRPLFDITTPRLPEQIEEVARGIYEIVFAYGGTITAEHGMGRLRAPYLEREWGTELYTLMKEIKTLFDPEDFFNPGVMFGEAPITEHLDGDLLQDGGRNDG